MNEELLELELRYGVQISTLIEVRDPLGNRESVSRDVEHYRYHLRNGCIATIFEALVLPVHDLWKARRVVRPRPKDRSLSSWHKFFTLN